MISPIQLVLSIALLMTISYWRGLRVGYRIGMDVFGGANATLKEVIDEKDEMILIIEESRQLDHERILFRMQSHLIPKEN